MNDRLETYVYSGNISAQAGNFEESFAKDYAQSLPANASGSIRMSFSDCYNRYGKYTMTLYFSGIFCDKGGEQQRSARH